MGKTEPEGKSMSEKEFNDRIRISRPPQLANPLFPKIQKVLDYKKQVILYGPPGTGKTWVANNFIKSRNTPDISVIKTNTDKKFFWFTTNKKYWLEPQTLDVFLENQEESEIWYGKIAQAYDEIKEGDIVIIYVPGRGGRIYGLASCSRKELYDEGVPNVFIRAIKPIQGPDWKTISADPVLQNSKPVRIKFAYLPIPNSANDFFLNICFSCVSLGMN